jgi:hypothetical protein
MVVENHQTFAPVNIHQVGKQTETEVIEEIVPPLAGRVL